MSSMDTPASPQTTNEDAPLLAFQICTRKRERKSDGTDKLTFSEQQPTSELVSKAQAFLESPELKGNDADSKTQFLVTKGIPAETADELQKALASIPRLTTELKAHKGKSLTADSVAPTSESKEPISSTKLQQLRAQVSDIGPKTNRQHTLQSLSDLTGYLSSLPHHFRS
ncbi:peroxisomal membrane anchor protein (Pex14) [Ceratobasidium sp. AG-Ba]|nr:peroxisomal membrane anchor protein (Pex14) [Ceratobasidium sp. AG-Ba]